MLFIPKLHCELNPVERVWGQAKFTRMCTLTRDGFRGGGGGALGARATPLAKKLLLQ